MTRAAVLGGRYRLDTLLAEGGMGEVWRARDQLLERDVAVKLLRSSLASDAVVAERFRREARASASLSHPNMANVFDFVEEDGKPGIVMELVDGPTLGHVIASEAPMPPQRAVALIGQVLDALGAAHAAGVVHRDVKPGNVILDAAGQARVTDFGIARAVGESTLTETGTVLGSVHYLAPEQLEGGALTPSSDLYAVGVMLYEMLTAKRPFEGETAIATALSRLANEPDPPSRHRADLPPAIEAVILRALQRDPAARFDTALRMRDALARALTGEAEPDAGATAMIDAPAAAAPPAAGPARLDETLVLPVASEAPTEVIRTRIPPRAKDHEPDHGVATPKRLRKLLPLWIALLIGLIVLTVIGIVAALPKTVTLPGGLVGMQLDDAIRKVEDAGFVLDPDTDVKHEYSSKPADEVLKVTSPRAGVPSPRGTHVQVVVSAGEKPCCTVPDLTGKTVSEARSALTAAGVRLGDTSFAASEAAAGTVVDQSARSGSSLGPGSEVDIVVSAGREDRRGDGKGKGKGDD